jgi:hypothetical protein
MVSTILNIADGLRKLLTILSEYRGISQKDGIDPFYLFEVASRGKPAGVCRHGNCALGGLFWRKVWRHLKARASGGWIFAGP